MTFIIDMIKGVFMGIANIIPGVSGGTMALSLGIYDKLIEAVSELTRKPKKSFAVLAPILVGILIGLIGFTYIVEYLLSSYTFITCMAFIGLIIGGLPMLIKKLKQALKESGTGIGFSGGLSFVILFSIAVFLPLLTSESETMQTLSPSAAMAFIIFLVGMVASATMVVPGVSGSMVLMILGYYYGILNSIKTFFNALKMLDISAMTSEVMILVPCTLGIILGILLIAKLITFLFKEYAVQTYCAILGLVISSPFAIIYNTGVINQLDGLSPGSVIIGLICATAGFVLTNFVGEK